MKKRGGCGGLFGILGALVGGFILWGLFTIEMVGLLHSLIGASSASSLTNELLLVLAFGGLPFFGAVCTAGAAHRLIYHRWERLYIWGALGAFLIFGVPQMVFRYNTMGGPARYMNAAGSAPGIVSVPSVDVHSDHLVSSKFRYEWPGYELMADKTNAEPSHVAVENTACTQAATWWAAPTGHPEVVLGVLRTEVEGRLALLGAAHGDITISTRTREGGILVRGDTFTFGYCWRISAFPCGEPGLFFSVLTAAETLETMIDCHEEALRHVECYRGIDE